MKSKKCKLALSSLLLAALMPLTFAHQSPPLPRKMPVKVGDLGEDGKIFARDIALPTLWEGFQLLKGGKRDEAKALFTAELHTDTTGVAAVGLAQATSPAQWGAQIKDLHGLLNRKQNDIRLAFRLGTLMYYESVSHNPNGFFYEPADEKEFKASAALLLDLWKRTHDPLTGMMLTEMTFRHPSPEVTDVRTLLEKLIEVVGGKQILQEYTQAKQKKFAVAPPPASMVPEDKRHMLVGVLTSLWSKARTVGGTVMRFNSQGVQIDDKGKPLPPEKRGYKTNAMTPEQKQEATYIDTWIKTLTPNRRAFGVTVSSH